MVAIGATSGNARVLQNSVMSNAVSFTVDALQLASISPNSGAAGTVVTFTGSGFGASQGSGIAWLGSASAGAIQSWSDTQVVATVASGALSGIARIQQNGVWSNALGFTVPGGNTLAPSLLNMVVGETRTIQALSATGQPVTGLTWTSSDPTVVRLSTDDPPLVTALAAGHVIITAGTGSADVTVSSAPLPLGTVIWSNPGDGSGVTSIVPAVPSTSGVADVFAFQADGTVAAITADGKTAWTASSGNNAGWSVVPDFQGGLVAQMQSDSGGASIVKFDGITGQAYPAYTPGPASSLDYCCAPVVHPDGTIFAVQDNWTDASHAWPPLPTTVVGIDPTTGAAKFSVPLPSQNYMFALGGPMIVAGDGYAYLPYSYTINTGEWIIPGYQHVLQISSSGASADIPVFTYPQYQEGGEGGSVITNGDQGVLVMIPASLQYYMATVTGGSVGSVVKQPTLPPNEDAVGIEPVLQAQDGSFVGVYLNGNGWNYNMVAFDAGGGVRWIVPNETPQIATADGGVIGQSGIIYDQSGNATGQMIVPTLSWTGTAYEAGPVNQVWTAPIDVATTYWAFAALGGGSGGTPSSNGTAGQLPSFTLKGPKIITTTLSGTALVDCSGQPDPSVPVFYGWHACGAYTLWDKSTPPKQIVRGGVDFDEKIEPAGGNVSVVDETGSAPTDRNGVLTDEYEFGTRTHAPAPGAYVIYRQTIRLHSTGTVVRANCLDYEVAGPTVTDITAKYDPTLPASTQCTGN